MKARHSWRVAVIGGREATPEELDFARQVGELLARHGFLLYTGGGSGIMEAASRGAAEAGGTVIGILPEETMTDMNPYVQIPILTGLGNLRNGIIIRSVEAAVAVGGRFGTLSEIAFALAKEIPVVGFNTWEIPGVVPVSQPQEAVERLLAELRGE